MKKLLLAAVFALAAVAMVVTVATAKNGNGHRGNGGLHGHLNGYQEVPPVSTVARGDIKLKISSDSIEYRLRYDGLEAGVLFAHIHFGQTKVNGGVVAFLCGGGGKPACPQSGTVTGTIVPGDIVGPKAQGIDPDVVGPEAEQAEFDEAVRAIKHGLTYANVHTEKFESGEIRGQIDGRGNGHHKGFGRGHDKDND